MNWAKHGQEASKKIRKVSGDYELHKEEEEGNKKRVIKFLLTNSCLADMWGVGQDQNICNPHSLDTQNYVQKTTFRSAHSNQEILQGFIWIWGIENSQKSTRLGFCHPITQQKIIMIAHIIFPINLFPNTTVLPSL